MERHRVKNGTHIDLSHEDPEATPGFDGDKDAGEAAADALSRRLEALQELLYAEGRHRILVVLQSMDTGGKDGVIRHVFEGVNPQGVKVAAFKTPTPIELAHDYLWRAHPPVPGRGEIVIFNRSYYEDVLVVRVRNLAPKDVWSRRFEHINAFERMLVDEGTTVLKFFLHIDRDEQKKRLQARLDDPTKRWKFRLGDLDDRALWDEYEAAYEDVLARTSTDWAPWYLVPANRKWYRNLVVGDVLVRTLEGFKMRYPEPAEDLSQVVIP
jgi:PPK2 family polyphosphate:nucleotide phosphotransferase